jgi:hypothetical protein
VVPEDIHRALTLGTMVWSAHQAGQNHSKTDALVEGSYGAPSRPRAGARQNARLDRAIANVTRAIAECGALPPLVDRLKTEPAKRQTLVVVTTAAQLERCWWGRSR